MSYRIKLIPSQTDKKTPHAVFLYVILFFALLFISGCATKPWGDPLKENEQTEQLLKRIETAHKNSSLCPTSWDADLDITWETAVTTKRFTGYFQGLQPSSFKFVSSNPLGQPLLAISSDGSTFQILDVLNKQYTHGATRSYALHSNIPIEFVSGSWGQWLAGRIPDSIWENPVLKEDNEGAGVWLSGQNSDELKADSHYLIDLENLLIQEQRLLNNKGKLLATFSFVDFSKVGNCLQPQTVEITDLPFGTKILLQFNELRENDAITEKSLGLPIPQHYYIKYLP